MKITNRYKIRTRLISAVLSSALLLGMILVPGMLPARAVNAVQGTVTISAETGKPVTEAGTPAVEVNTGEVRMLNEEWDTSFLIDVQVNGEWFHYTDQDGKQYVIADAPIRASFSAPDYWYPLQEKYYALNGATEQGASCELSYSGNSTVLSYTAQGWSGMENIAAVQMYVDWQGADGSSYSGLMRAIEQPDANGAIQLIGSGDGWADHQSWFKADEATGLYSRLPNCVFLHGDILPASHTGLYEGANGELQVNTGPVSITAPDGNVIGSLTGKLGGHEIMLDATGIGTQTASFDYSGRNQDLELYVEIGVPITVTFTANPLYKVMNENYEPITEARTIQGGEVWINLEFQGYALTPDTTWRESVLGYTLTTAQGTQEVRPPNFSNVRGDIAGITFLEDTEVSFMIDESSLIKTINVIPSTGPGYQVTQLSGAMPGRSDSIDVEIRLEPDYNESVFTVNLPDGYVTGRWEPGRPGTAPEPPNPGQEETGPMRERYYFSVMRSDGSFFPEGTQDIPMEISGVVKNPGLEPPPSSGGGSYRPSKPKIRVENDLDHDEIASDTKLWPNNTTERNGVSRTTVTDMEVDALIDLARKHAEDAGTLAGDGYKESTIIVEDNSKYSKITTYELELDTDQFERISREDWDRLNVKTPAGTFSLHKETISQTAAQKGKVIFHLERTDHEGKPALDVKLSVGDNEIKVFEEPYGIKVLIPYQPAEDEDINALVIEYIHEDGTRELVTECKYDEKLGGIYFYVGHLSKFGVAYRPAAFRDTGAEHWANPYITFLTSRGVISGGTDGSFRPDDKATRADFVLVLTKALSAAKPPKKAVQVYEDVPAGHYAAEAVQWLWVNNLDYPINRDNRMRPGEPITRQDAVLLVNNIIRGIGLRVRSKGLDQDYTDLDSAAAYARAPARRMAASGILEMNESHKFFPSEVINRGEMARIVANLLSNM